MTDVPRTLDDKEETVMKLWISSAMSPYGNPYGLIAVIAETREEAITKAREWITSNRGSCGYVPIDNYAQNILNNLDTEMEEATSGVVIDWSPAEKR